MTENNLPGKREFDAEIHRQLDEILSRGVTKSSAKLPLECVAFNRWDRSALDRARDVVRDFDTGQLMLAEQLDSPELSGYLWRDTFMTVHKYLPVIRDKESVDPSVRLHHEVLEQLQQSPTWEQLRSQCQGDPVASAMATAHLRSELEEILERSKERDELMQRIQQLTQQLMQMRVQLQFDPGDPDDQEEMEQQLQDEQDQDGQPQAGAGDGEGDEDGEQQPGGGGGQPSIADQVQQFQQLEQQLLAALEELNEGLADEQVPIAIAVDRAGQTADQELTSMAADSQAWGIDPANWQRMPAEERLALAERLRDSKLKQIAELFGRVRRDVNNMRRESRVITTTEMVGVTTGDSLRHTLPSELALLATGIPILTAEFMRRLNDRELIQRDLEAKDETVLGGIVYVEDGSGSMMGQPNIWAKAIGLCLLDIAIEQGRKFSWVHFSTGEPWIEEFPDTSKVTPQQRIDLATWFSGGGPLRNDQRVATPQGWREIGSLNVGDMVFGRNGKPTRVEGVYPQGVLEKMYEVEFSDGAKVICDSTHIWRVQKQVGGSRNKWIDMTLEEMLALGIHAGANKQRRYNVPICEPVSYPTADLPIDPYLLGVLIGDGCFTEARKGTPHVAWSEEDAPWVDVLPEGDSVTSKVAAHTDKCTNYWINGGQTWAGLSKLDMIGLYGHEKSVPAEYMTASAEQRYALLQGLLDSDGWADANGRGTAGYGTTSEALADQVVELARSLGWLAKATLQKPGPRSVKPYWKVHLRVPSGVVPFRVGRKASAFRPRERQLARTVANVRPVDPAECTCILVEDTEHLFLTEGYVVTHNTDYMTPLSKALEILQREYDENGAVSSDICMATDGYAHVDDDWRENHMSEMERLEATAWGIYINDDSGYGGYGPEVLDSVVNRTFTISDLTNGQALADMFNTIQAKRYT